MREQLIQDMEKAIAEVKQWPQKQVQIFHHNDSDGLSSGAILTRAFERAGFEIRRFSLEKPYPALLKKVYEQEGGLIVFADFAGRIAHTGPAMAGSDDKFGAPGHGTDDGQIVLTDGSKSGKKSQSKWFGGATGTIDADNGRRSTGCTCSQMIAFQQKHFNTAPRKKIRASSANHTAPNYDDISVHIKN